jgi:hypothetical protein
MRKITARERKKAGNIYCPFCKPNKVDAIWRIDGWYDKSKHVSCDNHVDKMTDFLMSELMTEADYQTWAK